MWSHDELPDAELIALAASLREGVPCECRTPEETGTRNGYTCSPHRAFLTLQRRGRALALLGESDS